MSVAKRRKSPKRQPLREVVTNPPNLCIICQERDAKLWFYPCANFHPGTFIHQTCLLGLIDTSRWWYTTSVTERVFILVCPVCRANRHVRVTLPKFGLLGALKHSFNEGNHDWFDWFGLLALIVLGCILSPLLVMLVAPSLAVFIYRHCAVQGGYVQFLVKFVAIAVTEALSVRCVVDWFKVQRHAASHAVYSNPLFSILAKIFINLQSMYLILFHDHAQDSLPGIHIATSLVITTLCGVLCSLLSVTESSHEGDARGIPSGSAVAVGHVNFVSP